MPWCEFSPDRGQARPNLAYYSNRSGYRRMVSMRLWPARSYFIERWEEPDQGS